MNLLKRIWRSSLGKKYIMAVTGGILVIFVLAHMVGNLQVFLGPEAINRYAHVLQHTPGILWSFRIGLLVVLGLHVAAATQLSRENKSARPVGYDRNAYVAATYASRTMLMSGLIVAAFIIYHLLHFTTHTTAINLTGEDFAGFTDPAGRHDVYRMMIVGFGNGWVSGFYLLGTLLLGLHLQHGISGAGQSLGLRTTRNARFFAGLAWTVAALVLVGNSSIPIAILLGFGQ